MSDTPTPRTDAASWRARTPGDPMGTDTVYASFARQLERELAEAKAELRKACAELPVSYYPDNTPEKLPENIAGFVKDYSENYGDLEKCQEQLTAHKAALEKCEGVIRRAKASVAYASVAERNWHDCAHEALAEIAKLKGTK